MLAKVPTMDLFFSPEGHVIGIVMCRRWQMVIITLSPAYPVAPFTNVSKRGHWCLWFWHGWSYGFVHNLCSQEPYGSIRNTSTQWKVYLIMHVWQITTDDVIMTTASCIISHKIYMLFYCALFCCGYSYSEISCAHTIFICNYPGSYHLYLLCKTNYMVLVFP